MFILFKRSQWKRSRKRYLLYPFRQNGTFFATSHRKNACDGVDGTLKWLAARISLQRPLQDQILTPKQFFKFVTEIIASIQSFFASSKDITNVEKFLGDWFFMFSTIKGRRLNHCFIAILDGKLLMTRISDETSKSKIMDIQVLIFFNMNISYWDHSMFINMKLIGLLELQRFFPWKMIM